MKWLKALFRRKKARSDIPPIPPYEEIVKSLYDKNLCFTDDLTVLRVLYSKDKTKRFIILKSNKGFYKYTYEEICVCDEDEWSYLYLCKVNDACPAWWETKDRSVAYSFFGTETEAMLALTSEPEYKLYF